MRELVDKLNYYAQKYYGEDISEIPDEEYDAMFVQLRGLEEKFPEYVLPDSPTKTVGVKASGHFKLVKHHSPMLSIHTETDYTEQGAIGFYNKMCDAFAPQVPSFICEPKYDGLAIDLTYEYNILSVASTRGDGYEGENVTPNIRTIKSIPNVLKNADAYKQCKLEIRGEILMLDKDFEELNKRSEGKQFSNPRNAAAGSVRQKDPKVTATRKLVFYPYSINVISGDVKLPKTQIERLELLKSFGFKLPGNVIVTTSW